MAAENSFDIVSKVDLQEVRNAIDQATKEVRTRFDLKDSKSEINLEGEDAIQLASVDEYKLQAVTEILRQKLVKRGVSLKALTFGKVEPAAGSSVRQRSTCSRELLERRPKRSLESLKIPKEGSGLDPGRQRPGFRQGPRCAAGSHRAAQGARSWHRYAVHELRSV